MIYTSTLELLRYVKSQMILDGITIKELSQRMNKSQSAVGSALRQKNISLDTLKEICDALNYKIDISIKKDDTE